MIVIGRFERHVGADFVSGDAGLPPEVQDIDLDGEELMEVAAASGLVVAQTYDEARDLIKYADTDAASVVRAQAGDVVVFWPEDAHMPSLMAREPGLVRKTVIKVPTPA